MADLLSMGAPIYWVIGPDGFDYSNKEHQNIMCGGQLCNNDSISTKLYIASNYPNM